MKLTSEELHKMFEYRDGNLHWKIIPPSNRNKKIGARANTLYTDTFGKNFDCVRINNTTYRTSKLVYVMFHGETPRILKHIDGNHLNNKIENLRG